MWFILVGPPGPILLGCPIGPMFMFGGPPCPMCGLANVDMGGIEFILCGPSNIGFPGPGPIGIPVEHSGAISSPSSVVGGGGFGVGCPRELRGLGVGLGPGKVGTDLGASPISPGTESKDCTDRCLALGIHTCCTPFRVAMVT